RPPPARHPAGRGRGPGNGENGTGSWADRALPRAALQACEAYRTRALVIDSPETTTSTRRFIWRPAALSLDATGRLSPNPRAEIEDVATPCWTRKSRTACARRSDNCW